MPFLKILLLIGFQCPPSNLCDNFRENSPEIDWSMPNVNSVSMQSFIFLICRNFEDHTRSRQTLEN